MVTGSIWQTACTTTVWKTENIQSCHVEVKDQKKGHDKKAKGTQITATKVCRTPSEGTTHWTCRRPQHVSLPPPSYPVYLIVWPMKVENTQPEPKQCNTHLLTEPCVDSADLRRRRYTSHNVPHCLLFEVEEVHFPEEAGPGPLQLGPPTGWRCAWSCCHILTLKSSYK